MNPSVKSEGRAADQATIRENKLALVERLADDLAHEIKNPLHSMVINLEVLRRRITRLENEGGRDDLIRYANVISTELDRVNRRVELLLRMLRPQRESEDQTTLSEILEEMKELIELECERQEVQLSIDIPEAIARGNLPRAYTRQMVLSLILQTLDTTPRGGALDIRSEIEASASRLRVCSRGANGDAAPIDPEDDDQAYLSVARALADRLGGQLEVEHSTPGTSSATGSCPSGYLLTIPR